MTPEQPETPSAEATCSNCNGKGYNTRCFDEIGHEDFGGDGYKKRGLIEKVPCKKCSSAGEGKILTGEQSPFLAPSPVVQNPEEMMDEVLYALSAEDVPYEAKEFVCKMFKDCCVMREALASAYTIAEGASYSPMEKWTVDSLRDEMMNIRHTITPALSQTSTYLKPLNP